jgi:hypothetical protein
MNSPEKEDLTNSDPKDKSETQNGLGNAHNIPEEPKKKQVKLRNDLENPNARLAELEEKEKELGSLRNDLKNTNSKIKELEEKEKELGSLRRDLENANSRIKELKVKEKELETLRKDLKNETTSLNKEHSHPGIASFLIQLYPPREGHYPGKVKHFPLEGKAEHEQQIKGPDDKNIAAFINKYLPDLEESFVAHEPVAPVPSKSAVETQIPAFKTAIIRKFTLVQEGKFQKERSITNDKIFQVTIVVDPMGSIVEENLPCSCEISVFAKRMGGGFKQILGKSDGQIIKAGEFTANVHCFPLPTGIYRIVAFGTINIKDDLKESIIGFHQSSIFCVT